MPGRTVGAVKAGRSAEIAPVSGSGCGMLPPSREDKKMSHVVDFSMRSSDIDVSPMIEALKYQPTDFEFAKGTLIHVPSRHRFRFDQKGHVKIEAPCNCSGRPVRSDLSEPLFQAFKVWRQYYWEPIHLNREFARHFETPGAWTRLFRDLSTAWRRFRRLERVVTLPAEAVALCSQKQSP